VIKQLKAEGYAIESVQNKGYCLLVSPDVLSKEEIQYKLDTVTFAKNIKVYNAIDSTNQEGKKLALEGAKHGTLLVADQQFKGKGRRGKSWESPPKTGIWMTLILRPDIHPNKASMLTLLAGLATVQTLNEKINNTAYIKWPNDIVVNGKKVCGILTEMSAELDFINYVVVGIGMNVNTFEFDASIQEVATSLAVEEGKTFERVPIIQGIIKKFEKYYELFVKSGDLENVLKDYEKNCINISKEVRIISNTDEMIGTALRITPSGELIVKDQQGQEHIIRSGEISVRGLNGKYI
jgi:BirA family biotin operon repressor/biotin-[acetyl-CoA-carboxylase] ligase